MTVFKIRSPGRTLPQLGIVFFSFLAFFLENFAFHVNVARVEMHGETQSPWGQWERAPDEHDFEQVRVLTYNIFMRPPLTPVNVVDDCKDERLEEFVKVLDRFDVICFQELFSTANSRRARLLEEAKARGFLYSVEAPKPKLLSKKFADGGVVVVSRLPIVESDVHIFTRSVQADALAAKAVIYARLRVLSDGDVHFMNVFTTHLQASYISNKSDRKNLEVREAQMAEMRAFVQEKLVDRGDELTVVLGDLNVNSRPRKEANSAESSGASSPVEVPRHSQDYLRMLELITPPGYLMRDLLFESHNFHPVTTGDVFFVEREKVSEGEDSSSSDGWLGDETSNPKAVRRKLERAIRKTRRLSNVEVFAPPPVEVSLHPDGNLKMPSVGSPPVDPDDHAERLNATHFLAPHEFLLTSPKDLCQQGSLDYIFVAEPMQTSACHPLRKLVAKSDRVLVEKFATRGNPFFSQLSDHYGVSAVFEFR